jgi:hypothetical protein
MNGRVISLEEAERSRPAARREACMEGRRASDGRAAVIFTPTPVKFRDPATIPRRQFIYGRHYIRAFLSATVAPGGVGKSSLALVEAVAMAAGRSLHGIVPPKATKVWYVNLEDPREEIERRIAAICLHLALRRARSRGGCFSTGEKSKSSSRRRPGLGRSSPRR